MLAKGCALTYVYGAELYCLEVSDNVLKLCTCSSCLLQINSAGLIFTSSIGRSDDTDAVNEPVISSGEISSHTQSDSCPPTSLELPPTLRASSSADALVSKDGTSEDAVHSVSCKLPKSASGYHMAMEVEREEGKGQEPTAAEGKASLPTSKELIELRQRKKACL